MKLKKLLIIIGAIFFICGCSDFSMICSLNPFYLDTNITLAPEMEGSWTVHPLRAKSDTTSKGNTSIWQLADTTSSWQIKQFISKENVKTRRGKDSTIFKPQKYYIVKLITNYPDSASNQFKMVLFQVKGHIYADFSPYETNSIKNSRMAKENYFTVHTLARVNIQNQQFNISWLGSDYMRDMIEKKRVRINYRYVHDAGRLLLTASSQELTHMIERYANETRFIDWKDQPAMLNLNRIK